MRFFDFGQRAEGFIAIGQEAVGVIAIGQTALGVVAIGQLARGVFVVGQLAIGVVAIGQLTVAVWGGTGMMALTGRWVKGLGVAIWPKREDHEKLPQAIALEQVEAGQPGYVEVDVVIEDASPQLMHDGERLLVTMDERVIAAAIAVTDDGYPAALVRLEQKEKIERDQDVGYRDAAPTTLYLEASKIIAVPLPRWRQPTVWAGASARSLGIVFLAAVWLVAAMFPLWNELFATKTSLLPDPFGFM